ncbi:MAG: ribosomal protein S12 methylthiotransferase RimO [Candidatus Melainabacteria bacterium RIFOXYA12_FULL_32_12]|nr:MAG: ribosomal protein S12 methylthiotransferase RimO [Candidatus Melainabacteria bacterium RIFOXYA2_FULL_32_9]OGI28324.1 MAG: ribosomal protein S12 methylthiotransferase RimO [Candidatus Melainabacteria bacterium RIFOXYA12_FULL_32_12]
MRIKPTIGLVNLGCPKNLVDAEVMLGILSDNGYNINLDEEAADIMLVNTCSFIKDAEKESVKAIVRLAESGKKLIITGCLAQKYKKELMEAVPEALAVIGTGDIDKIAQIVNAFANRSSQAVYQVTDDPIYLQTENINRFQITVGSSSYIKIAEGCDYSCAYCIIPALRGKYRSRSTESIVQEAKKLGQDGVSEIILIAQDTTSYGKDLYGKPSLAALLEKLNEVEEISWIRVMYTFPSLLNDNLIKTIAKLDKVVKYVDIPLQHSHPDILKLMNRPVMDNSAVIDKLRASIPDVAIRTAFIVGFPGEQEEHYQHLYEFIKKHGFDKLGVFEYSREKNTSSYSMKNQVPAKIKKPRRKELMQLQQGISKQINESFIGKSIPVIVESITSSGQIIGRSYRDAPEIDGLVYIETEQPLVPGDIWPVKIKAASEYDLFGIV